MYILVTKHEFTRRSTAKGTERRKLVSEMIILKTLEVRYKTIGLWTFLQTDKLDFFPGKATLPSQNFNKS